MIANLVFAAVMSAAFAQQAAPSAPAPTTPSAPLPSSQAHPLADFAGTWGYNAAESINAATKRPETARGNDRRGLGRGPVGGTGTSSSRDPGRGGGGGGGGRGGGGFGSSGIPPEALYSLYVEQRDTTRDLLEIAPELRIAVTTAAMTVTDDLDRALTFPVDGKKQKYVLGAATFDARTLLVDGQVKSNIDGPDGLKMTETWFLNEDGSRLFLIIRVGAPSKDKEAPPVGVNRVYDRAK